ncbi:cytochrome P450 4C1-like [Chrysoperla carnea]|uniref:cytochrome P450 4C1-like n=1 Tax=Chrysoperla carnea TaxID=189513 RepID=UPI001D06A598|nr:cytochrome P450 4C1-like [Chrysoperla carnea]
MYYVYKIPGPRAYPIIGNGLMLLGSNRANPENVQKILCNPNALNKPYLMRYLSYPMVGDSILVSEGSTMGVNINALEKGADFLHAMERCNYVMASRGLHLWKYPNIIFRLTDDYKQLKKHRRILHNLHTKIIEHKRQNCNMNKINNNEMFDFEGIKQNTLKKPLLDYLLETNETNPTFTDDDLRDETSIIAMAGFETIATAMSYCILSIAGHPEIQNKVYDEIFSIFGDSDRSIELEDLPKLEYLEMVIKESLRLYPVVPLIFRELSSDIKIDNYILTKGTEIAIPIYCIHRDPNLWENPLQFIPERFLPENISKQHPYSYVPFSGGPRNCLGYRYSFMFMKTVISTLLRSYEVHTDLNLRKLRFEMEIILKLPGGHQIRITPRNKTIPVA